MIITDLRDVLEGEEIGYVTVADTLIALNYRKRGNRLEKVITVPKMHGSRHVKLIHERFFSSNRVLGNTLP